MREYIRLEQNPTLNERVKPWREAKDDLISFWGDEVVFRRFEIVSTLRKILGNLTSRSSFMRGKEPLADKFINVDQAWLVSASLTTDEGLINESVNEALLIRVSQEGEEPRSFMLSRELNNGVIEVEFSEGENNLVVEIPATQRLPHVVDGFVKVELYKAEEPEADSNVAELSNIEHIRFEGSGDVTKVKGIRGIVNLEVVAQNLIPITFTEQLNWALGRQEDQPIEHNEIDGAVGVIKEAMVELKPVITDKNSLLNKKFARAELLVDNIDYSFAETEL